MIKSLSKGIFATLIIFIIFGVNNYTFSAQIKNIPYLYLTPQSSDNDVKKFQNFFKTLKIYKGNIDGNYFNIKDDIITFQLKTKIISNRDELGAGYIGKKTFHYFDEKYGPSFKKVYLKFFNTKKEVFINEKCFIVSAYYSPLPNQKKYSTRSYSGDIKLNGNGTHGASGISVHPGFIAAPSNYSFGTKIKLEGLGIGVVEDRGGAIVRKGVRGHECDRLDIWMGYGDQGLSRALRWGKKKIRGEILNNDEEITISFPIEYIKYLAKKISPESKKEDIIIMQKLFSEAKLYSGKIDGKYNSFKKSVIEFQLKNKIIKNKNSYGAGYIGPKTINFLQNKYSDIFILKIKKDAVKTNTDILQKNNLEVFNKVLTLKEKAYLDKISIQILKKIKAKSGKDNSRFNNLKNLIKNNISEQIEKSNSIKTKQFLEYLKNRLN